MFWTLYTTIMLAFAAAFIGLGVLWLLSPNLLRKSFGVFARKKPVRIAGAFTIVFAALVLTGAFSPSPSPVERMALIVWSVLFFFAGLLRLIEPVAVIIAVRRMIEFSNTTFRFIALAYFLFAAFFYWIAKVAAPISG